MSTVSDLFTYLESEGIAGGVTSWGLVRRRMHDDQDQLVALTEDGGPMPEIGATEGIGDSAVTDPSVLVSVRGAPWDGDAAQAKAEEVMEALHGLLGVTLGSTRYDRIAANTAAPVFAGFDKNGRPLCTISFRCMRSVTVPT